MELIPFSSLKVLKMEEMTCLHSILACVEFYWFSKRKGGMYFVSIRSVKVSVSRSVVSDSWQSHGLQPARLLCP